MAYEDYMAQIAQNRQDVGQRIANLPQFEGQLREQVFGADQSIPSLRTQISGKVKALYDMDKRLADNYSNPNNPMYIRDPYQRQKYATQQHGDEIGTIGELQNMLGARQDVLGNAIEKGLKIYQAGIDAAKFEQESLLAELDAAIKIAAANRAAAGSGTTKKTKLSELIYSLGYAPPVDKSGNLVRNESGTSWVYDPGSDKMVAAEYPGLRVNDPNFWNYLMQNPEADITAGENYASGSNDYRPVTQNASTMNFYDNASKDQALASFSTSLKMSNIAELNKNGGKAAVLQNAIDRFPQLADPTYLSALNKLLDSYGLY